MNETAARQNDIRKSLTYLNSFYSMLGMARLKDIVSGLHQQMNRDCAELAEANAELEKIRAAYQRFRDLSALVQAKEARVKIGAAMLTNISFREFDEKGEIVQRRAGIEIPDEAGIIFEKDSLKLTNFSLWRIIREIVRQTAEIRVYELEKHLRDFGLKVTRAAVESAITTHPREFSTRKHGREKYVSLKGA